MGFDCTNIPVPAGILAPGFKRNALFFVKTRKYFWYLKKSSIFVFGFGNESDGPGRFPVKKQTMETKTFKTAKQVANELMCIANAFGLVYESVLIVHDMNIYAERQIEYADAMKIKNGGKFNYTENYYIREHGVEDNRARLDYFGGHLATVMVKFDMKTGEYTVTKNNA